MHDKKDDIIYVGKAISLKNRVRQYFQSSKDKSPKIKQMVSKIERFEYIVTDSELLKTTDEKTYIIAEMVGYADQNYFSYVFKKKYGVSPSKYRQQG